MTLDTCTPDAKNLLDINTALAIICQTPPSVNTAETVSLSEALGRIVAAEILAPLDLPIARNSAMDGYAFRSRDVLAGQRTTLKLVGTSWAGKPFVGPVQAGECVRIFTGAVLPPETDSVAIQEEVESTAQGVHLPLHIAVHKNVREIGEDLRRGQCLLSQGKCLGAADLGLLAASGIQQLPVYRRLHIGFCSTGDELIPVGQPLAPGQIYDSNRYMLQALLQNPAYQLTDLGVIPDNPEQLRQILQHAAQQLDVIISTGGVSVGAADHVKDILAEIGSMHFWKLAIKPGKPLAFGKIQDCVFFGLPGNPAAVLTTYQQIVSPALQHLGGSQPANPLRLAIRCTQAIKKSPGRQEFIRALLQQNAAGELAVAPIGMRGSHIMSSSSLANCFIVLAADSSGVEQDAIVWVEPFSNQL